MMADKRKKRNKIKHFPYHHTFRCTEESQVMLEYLLESTQYTKSELMRECITAFYKVCKEELDD